MDKLISQLKAILAAIAAWPVIAPLLDVLKKKRIIAAVIGLVAFYLVPTLPITPEWADKLGTIIFAVTLIASFGFTLEGVIKARGDLPTGTLEEYMRALISEILAELLNPTPDEPPALKGTVTPYIGGTGGSG